MFPFDPLLDEYLASDYSRALLLLALEEIETPENIIVKILSEHMPNFWIKALGLESKKKKQKGGLNSNELIFPGSNRKVIIK